MLTEEEFSKDKHKLRKINWLRKKEAMSGLYFLKKSLMEADGNAIKALKIYRAKYKPRKKKRRK